MSTAVAPEVAAPDAAATVSVFGIRHHGPGSARALVRALAELEPDVILVEGPPEADSLVALAASAELEPPVALLAYPDRPARGAPRQRAGTGVAAPDGTGGPGAGGPDAGGPSEGRDDGEPGGPNASFWPFAVFSPEWQAIRYAVTHGVPLRFCDLPAAHQFALRADGAPDGRRPVDALGLLAEAAGYEDAERWWDDVMEHRRDGLPPFVAIGEAMAAVRTATEADTPADPELDESGAAVPDREELREAYMRTVLRAARKEGFQRIAVVCGAWHVPALTEPLPPAARDAALLRGLPTASVAMTWVPWTHGRLAYAHGYGAGVASPGWYHHLFTSPDRVVERWLVQVAALLRGQDLPVSSAHVIEGTRLAETLAVLRGRPAPGLNEVVEATRAVLCDGDELRLAMVNDKLVVGDRLGSVPADTPAVPLVRDVAAAQKRLRLEPKALEEPLELDLRKETGLERSRLLHRLRLLGVDWGTPTGSKGKGTFWETWRLRWAPEFAVDLIAAGAYGTTVVGAATAKATESAAGAPTLADVTALVEACLLADLPAALGPVLAALDARVALDVDVAHLMDSLPALARSLRYGDVRGTGTGGLEKVVDGLVTRACVGLPGALAGLDDDAATAMRGRIDAVQGALGLLTQAPELREMWLDTIASVADRDDLHGLLAGRVVRLLADESRLSTDEVALRMGRTLTIGVPPATAAAWIEGFLSGGGLLLVHDEHLLALVDGWLAQIPADTFVDVLPLLRRTFATFAAPERRAIGERARHLGGTGAVAPGGRHTVAGEGDDLVGLDVERAMRVLPTLRLLLGTGGPGDAEVAG